MATSFGALCSDFYVNQKLALKMDLPSERETILHFFEAARKSVPGMANFRRYEGELALESSRKNHEYQWMSLQRTHIRTGHVNPQSMAEAYKYHQLMLKLVPYHLTISPLDVDFQEVMFGFDLECKSNHDEIVFDALFGESPLADLVRFDGSKTLDVQPVFGVSLSEQGNLQAYFEVKTRRRSRRGNASRYKHEPISIFVSLRRYGAVVNLDDMIEHFADLSSAAERLATDRLVPELLMPIAREITSSST